MSVPQEFSEGEDLSANLIPSTSYRASGPLSISSIASTSYRASGPLSISSLSPDSGSDDDSKIVIVTHCLSKMKQEMSELETNIDFYSHNEEEGILMATEFESSFTNRMEDYSGHHICNGFVYKKRGQYYYCSKYPRCKASCKVIDGEVTIIERHSHQPDENEVAKLMFIHQLKVASLDGGKASDVYHRVANLNQRGALQYPYTSAENMIARCRKKHLPPLPERVEGLVQILQDERWKVLGYDSDGQPFYRGSTISPHGEVESVVFISDRLSSLLCEEDWEAHCDGTFSFTPAQPHFVQMFVLHVVDRNELGQTRHMYPVVYAMMTSRTASAYQAVLEFVQQAVEGFRPPSRIIADFEPALRASFLALWPDIVAKGCWFHYELALCKRAVAVCQLQALLLGDSGEKRVFDLLSCLPLFPADKIDDAFLIAVEEAEQLDVDVQMLPLLEYVLDYWMEVVGPDTLSIEEHDHRTNNAVKSFYYEMGAALGREDHPSIYNLLKVLIRVDSQKARCRLQRLQEVQSTKQRALPFYHKDKLIRQELTRLRHGTIDVGGLLNILVPLIADSTRDQLLYNEKMSHPDKQAADASSTPLSSSS